MILYRRNIFVLFISCALVLLIAGQSEAEMGIE